MCCQNVDMMRIWKQCRYECICACGNCAYSPPTRDRSGWNVELVEALILDCWTKDWTRELLFKSLTLWIATLKTYGKPNVAPRITQLQDSLTPHDKATLAHFAFTRYTPTL